MEKKLSEYLTLAKNIQFQNNNKEIKIAILSSFTINGLDECLKVKSSLSKINYKSYIGNYNQHFQDIFNEKSNLYQFEPDLTFLIIDTRSFLGKLFSNPYSFTTKQRRQIFNEKINYLKNAIETFEKNSNKIHEAADVFYHLIMYLEANDIKIEEVIEELNKRKK